jgi:hypothetical protein
VCVCVCVCVCVYIYIYIYIYRNVFLHKKTCVFLRYVIEQIFYDLMGSKAVSTRSLMLSGTANYRLTSRILIYNEAEGMPF